MAIYPQDDDLDLERELADVEEGMDAMARDWPEMKERRRHLRKQIQKRQIDPLVDKALRMAQDLGHALGANEALGNKLKNMTKRIEIRDEELERTADRDDWKERAETAEAKLKRRRRR